MSLPAKTRGRRRKLLNHFNISARTISYHEHNEITQSAELVLELEQGARVALVTDAGTPGISDPGYRLVSLAIQASHAGGSDSRSCRFSFGAYRERTGEPSRLNFAAFCPLRVDSDGRPWKR